MPDSTLEDHLGADAQLAIGLSLSLTSSVLIGSSFVVKKRSLINLGRRGRSARDGGYGYLKDCLWWTGFMSMCVGEILNFVTYSFLPASLVAPLGAFGLVVTALLSSKLLGETLNRLGKVSCLLCIVGSTIAVIHSPQEGSVKYIWQLPHQALSPPFVTYVAVVVISFFILVCFAVPRWGSSYVLVYALICTMIGSLSVCSCKGLGMAVKEAIMSGSSDVFITQELAPITYTCLVVMVVCIIIQMNYLNKALDTFNTSVVGAIHYVLFTIFVILSSGILFGEFDNISVFNAFGCVAGFLTIVFAIYILQGYGSDTSVRIPSTPERKPFQP